MKLADLSELRDRIAGLAKKSPLGDRVQDVVVDAGDYGDGTDFLRVKVRMRDLETLQPQDVEPLVKSIEDEVALMDERFPSVRFDEAA